MKLYLLRHAIAEARSESGADEDRALTPKGRARMIRAAQGLKKMRVRPEVILTSPARRARETAEIVAARLDGVPVETMPELAAAKDPGSVVVALRARSDAKGLVIVGHQPGLGELASLLLSGSTSRLMLDLKKGSLACLDLELAGGAPRATLRWLVTPRLLRSL